MNIKHLSYSLVLINLMIASKELPLSIVGFILASVLLSFVINNKVARNATKLFILAISFIALKLSFKPLLVPEAGVSFILIISSLKLWELESETDHFNMFLILALVEGTLFLLMPTLLMFIIGFLKTASFFYFILKLRNYDLVLLNFRRILYLMVPALLFSVLLFYTFPRFTKGFSSSSGPNFFFSGSSSKLNFSNLGPINPSSKIIFRVYGLPSSAPYYWRSTVLWENQGNDWLPSFIHMKAPKDLEEIPSPKINYQIRLSDSYNEYLPTLDGTSKISNSSEEFYNYDDGSFRLKNILKREIRFSASTNTELPLSVFSKNMEKQATRLLTKHKEEIKKDIIGEKNLEEMNEKERLDQVLQYFKKKRFEYTLSPPLYSSTEEFIKNGKKGYCSHFAAAFVYMARSLNLPSRIVLGFQGGEYNPFDQSLIIRELDGHAWAEVYLSDVGWKRVDPTLYVAPTRIYEGAVSFNEQLAPNINFYYFQIPKSFFNFPLLNTASLLLDSINMKFNEVLMNFNKEEQLKILRRLLPTSFSIESVFGFALVLPLLIFLIARSYLSNKRMSSGEKRYRNFLKKMKSYGYEKYVFETATDFKNRCLSDKTISKKLAKTIISETNFYITAFYRS